MSEQHLILFDGDCAYCNGWVNWIRDRDPQKLFRFAPLASEEGKKLVVRHALPVGTDSLVLVRNERAYLRSDAAWRILQTLPGKSLWGSLLRWIPRFLRNAGYDLVARNRHRLGVRDECELPER